MAKPDDRSDNVQKLQRMIHNTEDNLREARDFYKAHDESMSEETKKQIKEKNARREDSISSFRKELKDEADHARKMT